MESSIGELPYYEYEEDYSYYSYSRRKRSAAPHQERRRRQVGYTPIFLFVDETVGRLTMQVTFQSTADRRLLEGVELLSGEAEECKENDTIVSRFGNIVHYTVECPCVGKWQLQIPYSLFNPYVFTAKSLGEFSISFDAMFEHIGSPRSRINERNKEPCIGERTILWVTLSQEEFISDDEIVVFFQMAHKKRHYTLEKDTLVRGQWKAELPQVPDEPFSVAVQGTTIEGNTFQRLLNVDIYPTKTCLKTLRMRPSTNTIKAGGQTSIIFALINKDKAKDYTINCFNDRRADGFETHIDRPPQKYPEVSELTTEMNRVYYIFLTVEAPTLAAVGEVVTVRCHAYSEGDSVAKAYPLMVASVYA